jgi:hypothetical protein
MQTGPAQSLLGARPLLSYAEFCESRKDRRRHGQAVDVRIRGPRGRSQRRVQAGTRRRLDAGSAGRNAVLDKRLGRPDDHEGRRVGRRGDRPRGPYENMGASSSARPRARPATSPATARRPRPCSPRRSCKEGMKFLAAGSPTTRADPRRSPGADTMTARSPSSRRRCPSKTARRSSRSARSPPTTTPRSASSSPTR